MIALLSCKKQDANPPVIEIVQPSADSFSYGEIIPIALRVSDDRKIDEIRVSIRERNTQVQVLQTLVFEENSSGEYTGTIPFDDIHINTGSYYIQAIASDGENEGAAIKNIQLTGAPLELTEIVGFDTSENSTTLYALANNGWEMKYSLPVKAYAFVASSYFQRYLFAGNTSQGLLSFVAENGNLAGQSPGLWTSETLWNASYYDETTHWWWLACKDGSIRAYSSDANSRIQFTTPGGFIPYAITTTDEYVVTASSSLGGNINRLDVFVKTTGQLLQSVVVPERIDLISTINNQQVWTYASAAEVQQKIYFFNGNYLDEWSNFRYAPEGEIIKVVRSNNRLFALYSDHLYSFSLNGQLLAETSINGTFLAYEKLGNALYVHSADWQILNANTLQTSTTVPNPLNLTSIMFLYNK